MSDTTRQVLDVNALASAVAAVARHRRISMRDVAAETGLSPSTLTRLTQGQKPDADGLVTLLAWLNADAADFAVPRDDQEPLLTTHQGRAVDARNNIPATETGEQR